MKKALAISITGHVSVLGALMLLGSIHSTPVNRGYPRLMMATLIQKPVMAQSSAEPPAARSLLEARPAPELPAPELKPVPSTKLGSKTVAPTKPAEKKSAPPTAIAKNTPSPGGKQAAAASGGNTLKIDAPEFAYPHYLVLLQFRIEANWQPPFSGIGQEVTTIHFKITREGEIQDVKVEKSSGNFSLDQAALRAVHGSNPLPPLPTGSGLETLGVHFEFVAN